jgi:hypothetical protein
LVNSNVCFRHKVVLYLNGSYLGGHFFLDPLNPVIHHIHSNNEPPPLKPRCHSNKRVCHLVGLKTKEVSCKIMPIIPFPCTMSCPGGGGAPSPENIPNPRCRLQQNIQSLSGDKLIGTGLVDVCSDLSQSIRPLRESVASLSLADYQAANLLSNSSKSFGLISSELLPFTVQSTPSLS